MKKIILLMVMLLVSSLTFSEYFEYSDWDKVTVPDDFTDTKTFIRTFEKSYLESAKDTAFSEKLKESDKELLLVGFSELHGYLYVERTRTTDRIVIKYTTLLPAPSVKLRVDDNAFSYVDDKRGNGNTVAFPITKERLEEFKNGEKLKIGIITLDGPKTLIFSLKGFNEAYKAFQKEQP